MNLVVLKQGYQVANMLTKHNEKRHFEKNIFHKKYVFFPPRIPSAERER